MPVLATTTTTIKKIEANIAQQMGGNLTIIRGNLMRENFRLFVVKVDSEDEKLVWLGQNLYKLPGLGILYTGTRVDTYPPVTYSLLPGNWSCRKVRKADRYYTFL